jgi:hypothetical protein
MAIIGQMALKLQHLAWPRISGGSRTASQYIPCSVEQINRLIIYILSLTDPTNKTCAEVLFSQLIYWKKTLLHTWVGNPNRQSSR